MGSSERLTLQPGAAIVAAEIQSARGHAVDSPEKIKDAAQQFEALLVQQMMQAMWKTVPQEGILSGSREEEYFRDMLNQALAESISKGQGIGVREVIEREMGRMEGQAQLSEKEQGGTEK